MALLQNCFNLSSPVKLTVSQVNHFGFCVRFITFSQQPRFQSIEWFSLDIRNTDKLISKIGVLVYLNYRYKFNLFISNSKKNKSSDNDNDDPLWGDIQSNEAWGEVAEVEESALENNFEEYFVFWIKHFSYYFDNFYIIE